MNNGAPGDYVSCPICLSRLSWNDLTKYRWDSNKYIEIVIPPEASPEQRSRAERGAFVKCSAPESVAKEHYLPADYGSYGKPVIVGFIGATASGKSHLLAAMVGAIEAGGLGQYGITHSPVDLGLHRQFLAEYVRPMLDDNKVLDATGEDIVSFVDAYLMGVDGQKQPIALFDVSGSDLIDVPEQKQFLDIADGLIFVIDPTQIRGGASGDATFTNVLGLLQKSGRFPHVSAVVVINKADLIRFEEPIANWWFRSDGDPLQADLIMRESADVYAYLHSQGANTWIAPFNDCARVSLHIASATGGSATPGADGIYPRGVRPHRVLTPLVALLAMTGVISGAEAEKVGV